MRFTRKKKAITPAFDFAPMIDVVFLLLIFFLLTSSHILQSSVKVDLPANPYHAESRETSAVMVTITAEDKILYGSRAVSFDELYEQLKGISARNPEIIVMADKKSTVGSLVTVKDICRSAGIKPDRIKIGAVSKKNKGQGN